MAVLLNVSCFVNIEDHCHAITASEKSIHLCCKTVQAVPE